MRDDVMPVRTEAGWAEIRHRSGDVAGVLRPILLLVDGQRTAGQLCEVIAGVRAPDDALEQLLVLGLIGEPAECISPQPDVERYTQLRAVFSESACEHLGLRGYFLQLKIGKCSSADDLRALLPEGFAAFARVRNMATALDFAQRVRDIDRA